MTSSAAARVQGDVLLVGSLPFDNVEEALRGAAEGLHGHAFALPDGEVGPRQLWVGFLSHAVFSGHPQLDEEGGPGEEMNGEETWTFRVKPGEELRFDDLHYGRIAIESYAVFKRLRDEGIIEPHVRFQVSLPAPSSAINSVFDDPSQWPMVHRAYADALEREIAMMVETIPADSLAIQYDLAWEVVDLSLGEENFLPFWPQLTVEEKFAAHTELLPEISSAVPPEVLLGYHWCYGTWGGWPMTAMKDLQLCVDLSNAAVQAAGRPVDFVHMPVARQPDEAFFAPLDDLEIGDTKVFLGLVHHSDGVEGFRERAQLAKRHLDDFGIASVCGYGRVNAAELPSMLALHRECADLLRGVGTLDN